MSLLMGVQSLFYFHWFFERAYSTARCCFVRKENFYQWVKTKTKAAFFVASDVTTYVLAQVVRQTLTHIVPENSEVELAQ